MWRKPVPDRRGPAGAEGKNVNGRPGPVSGQQGIQAEKHQKMKGGKGGPLGQGSHQLAEQRLNLGTGSRQQDFFSVLKIISNIFYTLARARHWFKDSVLLDLRVVSISWDTRVVNS